MCSQQLTDPWNIYHHHSKIHCSIRQLCAQPELEREASPVWHQPPRETPMQKGSHCSFRFSWAGWVTPPASEVALSLTLLSLF